MVKQEGFHVIELLDCSEDHFPEVSATVTVVRAHWSVVALYDILKPWLTEHVQNKAPKWHRLRRASSNFFSSSKGTTNDKNNTCRESSHCFGSTGKRTNIYIYILIYCNIYIYYIVFIYIQFLGPVHLPPGMCVVTLSLCGKPAMICGNCHSCMQKWSPCVFGLHFQNDMNLHFATVWERCPTLHRTPCPLPHCLLLLRFV